ncbi:MAG TPA: GNAT family N-acetyltransferase [Flavitalea sp.]|nr:GNAT family N-acetyltransferase [Flavitalea sp.]
MMRIKQIREEGSELDIIRELFQEYEKELDTDLCFQQFGDELKDPLKKYGKPRGTLILAYWSEEPAGCIALTPMKQDGLCEMKRLYVRPAFRKYGIGRTLVTGLIDVARTLGYQVMRLDTFKKLKSAIILYESFGFNYIDSYYNNPFPDVVYMELRLV